MEHYGDIHLHQSDYPNDPYKFEGECRYNALNSNLYDNYPQQQQCQAPLGMNRCHVEYCHPGSWQSRCGNVRQYSAANNNDSCNRGVFGDEAVGKYDNYIPENQMMIVKALEEQAAQQQVQKQPSQEQVMAAVEQAVQEEQYWTAYRIMVWLFVLAVGFIVLRKIARR